MITTDMSANIVADLLKQRWSVKRIAQTIGASPQFVKGVQNKKHVLTRADLEAIAAKTGGSASLLLLDSIKDVPEKVRPLFESTRRLLEACAAPIPTSSKVKNKTRRSRTHAA
jgi:hypothetical protein